MSRNGIRAVCLADGAGSAARAEFGAQQAVNSGCALMTEAARELFEMSDAKVRSVVLTSLLTRLQECAQRLNCELGDLAATFLAVAVFDESYLVVQVGDGVIGAEEGGRLVVLSGPDNGEFANETVFLTSSRAEPSMRVVRGSTASVAGFILMSDGAAESLHDQRANLLARACSKLMRIVAEGRGSGKSTDHEKQLRRIMGTVIRERTDDDCAIAILAR